MSTPSFAVEVTSPVRSARQAEVFQRLIALTLERGFAGYTLEHANSGNHVKVGDLERRIRFGSLHATFQRPRVRTYSPRSRSAWRWNSASTTLIDVARIR